MSGVPTVCYDLSAVNRFLRSVAQAVAMQQHTHIHWQPYRESAVINAIYTVLAWKEPPGTVEVVSDSSKIEHRTNELHERMLMRWIDLVCENPRRAADYLEEMQKIREYALRSVHEAMADARSINAEIIGETNTAIRTLQGIKLGATVAGAALGITAAFTLVGGAALKFSAASVTGGVACKIAQKWDDGAKAVVVGVMEPIGKEAMSQGLERGVGKAGNSLIADPTPNVKIMEKAARRIQEASNRLAKQGLSRTARRTANRNLGKATQQFSTAQAAIARGEKIAQGTKVVGKSVPVVFALWEVVEEVKETMAIWEQTR